MPKKTKAELTARDRLFRDISFLMQEYWIPGEIETTIPPEWHTMEHDVEVTEKKQKVTLYLDAPVARYYRAMGNGYQERINRLLSTWMNMKLAGEIQLNKMLEDRVRLTDEENEKGEADAPDTTRPGLDPGPL